MSSFDRLRANTSIVHIYIINFCYPELLLYPLNWGKKGSCGVSLEKLAEGLEASLILTPMSSHKHTAPKAEHPAVV